MVEGIVTAVVGIICIVIGIFNRKGHLEMLHSYHRERVTEENKLPFGKLVGAGMIVMGSGLIAFGGASAVTFFTEKGIFTTVGIAVMAVGMVVGLGLAFYAMIKYNKGIF